MRPFKFRGTAALELRRQQEDAAAVELSRKEACFRAAMAACAAAELERENALKTQVTQSTGGIDMAAVFWHRNWIIRLQAMVVDLRTEQRACSAAAETARQAWQIARRRRMALERMRDRALARHRAQERQHEARVIDELARVRFTNPDTGMETEK